MSELELVHPWALVLLALPLVMRLLPAYKESRDSVRVPFFDKLVELSEQRPDTGAMILRRDRAQHFLVGFTWLCLVLAAAKPTVDRPTHRATEIRARPDGCSGPVRLHGDSRFYPAQLAKPWADWRRSNAV